MYLPSEEIEALKECTRARDAKKRMFKKARQELLSFLLRNGKSYPESGSYWTEKFFSWIKTVQFSGKWMQKAFNECLAEVCTLKSKGERQYMGDTGRASGRYCGSCTTTRGGRSSRGI